VRAEDILRRAADLVSGDRATTHGDKRQNHDNIASLWTAYLGIRRDPAAPLRGRDVANMMGLLKIARGETGSFNLDDSVDGAAYLAIAGQLDAEDAPRG
jgi:hypothetical protein